MTKQFQVILPSLWVFHHPKLFFKRIMIIHVILMFYAFPIIFTAKTFLKGKIHYASMYLYDSTKFSLYLWSKIRDKKHIKKLAHKKTYKKLVWTRLHLVLNLFYSLDKAVCLQWSWYILYYLMPLLLGFCYFLSLKCIFMHLLYNIKYPSNLSSSTILFH